MEEAKEQRLINPWSDMEKCIFLDRFLQHPKDFRKIASFLKNKTVHDCISFYYDSKQTIPYKRALKEHLKRKKRRGDTVKWDATIQAAMSVGATVQVGISTEKPLIFDLPRDDMTFDTYHFHPLKREVFDVVCGDYSPFIEVAEEMTKPAEVKKPSHKRKFSAVGNLFILDPSKRKFLRSTSETIGMISPTPSDGDNDSQKARRGSNNSANDGNNNAKNESVKKIIPHKWSAEEKVRFHEAVEKYGKKWNLLSDAIGTKSIMQVKNFYYEHKRQMNKKASLNAKLNTILSEEPQQPPSRESPQIVEGKDGTEINKSVSMTDNSESDKVVHGFTQENMIGLQERKGDTAELHGNLQNLRPDQWNDQQRQLALAIERHRQQQLAERQQQLLEFQRQHEQERARQLNQLQMQNILSHHQNQQQIMSNLNSIPSWVAAQQIAQAAMHHEVTRQQRSFHDYLDGGSSLQNVAYALRQQQQNNLQLGMNSNNNENDGSQRQQTNNLNILAQMADANRNLDSSNH